MRTHYVKRTQIAYYGRLPENVEQTKTAVTGEVLIATARMPGSSFDERLGEFVQDEHLPIPSSKPFDLRKWSAPPHVELANLADFGLGPIYRFTKNYGYLCGDLDFKASLYPTTPFKVDIVAMKNRRDLLRDGWTADKDAIEELKGNLTTEARLRIQEREIETGISDLWTLIRILFLWDHEAGRTKLCASPDCPAPYFVQTRKDQLFCSHRCVTLINVRRFREREKKLKESKGRKRGGRKGK